MPTAYPIATDAHNALTQLRAGTVMRAVREKEAETAAGRPVTFVTQAVGPVYDSEAEATKAYAGLLGDGVAKLTCRARETGRRKVKSVQPAFRDGERWPRVMQPAPSVWQLTLGFWQMAPAAQTRTAKPVAGQARQLRKKAGGETLTPDELLALSQNPLLAVRPQKALDFGLFDFPLPENPGIIIADE